MSLNPIGIFKSVLFFCVLICIISCSERDPIGNFKGEIKDWVYEVFEGTLIVNNKTCNIELTFQQLPDGQVGTLLFQHPERKDVIREGIWQIEDGYRSIVFSDNKYPSEYYLIKKGVRYAFQTKEGLSNDDGSPILLMRNEGKSRKTGYPFKIIFEGDNKVILQTITSNNLFTGEWKWNGGEIIVIVKIKDDELDSESNSETYKYFLSWNDDGESLLLKKMLITRPFKKKDGSMRQSWMSSLVFEEQPKLKPY
jgi:hypothetical protein